MQRLDHARIVLTGRLLDRGVSSGHLDFHDAREARRRPAGRSDFHRNRLLGDWAEARVAEALQSEGWRPRRHGEHGRLPWQDPAFAAAFREAEARTRRGGKRPDLLCLLPVGPANLRACGVEVRASWHDFMRHRTSRARDEARGIDLAQGACGELSFTLKLDELVDMHRWTQLTRTPQLLAQVFVDEAHAINLLDLFEHIAAHPGSARPARKGGAPLLRVPVSCGRRLGPFDPAPRITARLDVSRRGHYDASPTVEGGRLRLDPGALLHAAFPPLEGRASLVMPRVEARTDPGATYRPATDCD